jgi:light-regulated signal transduction histidine kinase (bacteriophytochrome)
MSVDITTCDREPIHIPGFIQPHGMLLALREGDLHILQASDNTAPYLGRSAAELLGAPLGDVLSGEPLQLLQQALGDGQVGTAPLHVFSAALGGERFRALLHRHDGILILELEREVEAGAFSFQNLYSLVSGAVSRLEGAQDAGEMCRLAAREVRRLTGLDKVMVYLFDEEFNGTVVAEDRAEHLDAYLGLRFPASDIPRQARDLYLRNRLRLISDVHSVPVPIIPTPNPQTGRSLDLSYSMLRSVSPIHIEYLKNMGVGASMSVSIIQDGRLAGLIACHHSGPKYLPFEVRAACEFLGQVLALQLSARERTQDREQMLRLSAINSRLLEGMAGADDYISGLAARKDELLELASAHGVAICTESDSVLLGETPAEAQVNEVVAWLAQQGREVLATDSLSQEHPAAGEFSDRASGVLAISVSEVHHNFIVWFRPEAVQSVSWAGNPNKPVEEGEPGGRLHPRHSFEVWKETVRARSLLWRDFEVEAARELRAAIVGIVLRQAEQRAQLSTELERSNRELEAFSYSVSHDLRAPFRHILGFATMLEKRLGDTSDATSLRYLSTITESAQYAGTLVDNLLAFSRMGRAQMRLGTIDMGQLVQEARAGLEDECAQRTVEWHIGELPTVHGDLAMLRLAVQNLLSNAVKYTRGRERAVIEVESWSEAREQVFRVRDNGVGFDMAYSTKLFGVFQRLHRAESSRALALALPTRGASCCAIGGRTWAEGAPDEGASFTSRFLSASVLQAEESPSLPL